MPGMYADVDRRLEAAGNQSGVKQSALSTGDMLHRVLVS